MSYMFRPYNPITHAQLDDAQQHTRQVKDDQLTVSQHP